MHVEQMLVHFLLCQVMYDCCKVSFSGKANMAGFHR